MNSSIGRATCSALLKAVPCLLLLCACGKDPPCEHDPKETPFFQPSPEDDRWRNVLSFVDPCAAERYHEVHDEEQQDGRLNWDYPTLAERYRRDDFCEPFSQFEESHAPAWGAGLLMDPQWFVTHSHVLYGRCHFPVFRNLIDGVDDAESRMIKFCRELQGVWVCKLEEAFGGDFSSPIAAADLEEGKKASAVAFGHPWGLRLKALYFEDTGRASACEDVPMYPYYYASGSVIYREAGVVGLHIRKNSGYTHSPCQGLDCVTASVCDRKPVTYLPFSHALLKYHEVKDKGAGVLACGTSEDGKEKARAQRSKSRSLAEWRDGMDSCSQPAALPPIDLAISDSSTTECPGVP